MIKSVNDNTLFFNGKFECGNLKEVDQIGEFEYNLTLNFDFNTTMYT